MAGYIATAQADAERQGVSGKAVTSVPAVTDRGTDRTGAALATNIALVKNNARPGGTDRAGALGVATPSSVSALKRRSTTRGRVACPRPFLRTPQGGEATGWLPPHPGPATSAGPNPPLQGGGQDRRSGDRDEVDFDGGGSWARPSGVALEATGSGVGRNHARRNGAGRCPGRRDKRRHRQRTDAPNRSWLLATAAGRIGVAFNIDHRSGCNGRARGQQSFSTGKDIGAQLGSVGVEGDAGGHVEDDLVAVAGHRDAGAAQFLAQRCFLLIHVIADHTAGQRADARRR